MNSLGFLAPAPPERHEKNPHTISPRSDLQVFVHTPSEMVCVERPTRGQECFVSLQQHQELWADYIRLTRNFLVAQEENNRLHQAA
jgi:hypothetical protein